jgi:lambda family phage portal protein
MKKRQSFKTFRPASKSVKMDSDPVSAAFDAGGTGRRSENWGTNNYSPNNAVVEKYSLIVERSRDAQRKNSFAQSARMSAVSDEVGSQITPMPNTPWSDFNEAMMELWTDHEPDMVAGGIVGGYGAIFLAVAARNTSGEVFIRRRPRFKSDKLTLPVQIQLLESDFCPMWLNTVTSNNNLVINGIEYDSIGNRMAYWMYKSHPQERNLFDTTQLVRVPAADIIHHFIPELGRIGQQRGTPRGIQSLVPLRVMATYDDNESEKAASQAGFVAFVRKNTPSPEQLEAMNAANSLVGENPDVDIDKVPEVNLEAGTVQFLADDEDITFAPSHATGQGYKDFQYHAGLRIAAGFGVSYAQMTGDWSQTNDRVLRFAANNERRIVRQRQSLFTIPQVCQGIWNWCVDAAVVAGLVSVIDYAKNKRKYQRCQWTPEAFDYIHPVQDVQSKILLKDNGYIDRDTQIRERNGNGEQIDLQRAKIKQREIDLGLAPVSPTTPTGK